MIVVVEGISASGKTTLCAPHARGYLIPENAPMTMPACAPSDTAAVALFWAERNADRWRAALAKDDESSVAVCDTDPLKLHYIWCLWQIAEATDTDWQMLMSATRKAVAKRRLGFADHYLVNVIDPVVARQRAMSDASRRRRNIELHLRLQPALERWYSAIEAVLSGRVCFGLPAGLPAICAGTDHYSLDAFDSIVGTLGSL